MAIVVRPDGAGLLLLQPPSILSLRILRLVPFPRLNVLQVTRSPSLLLLLMLLLRRHRRAHRSLLKRWAWSAAWSLKHWASGWSLSLGANIRRRSPTPAGSSAREPRRRSHRRPLGLEVKAVHVLGQLVDLLMRPPRLGLGREVWTARVGGYRHPNFLLFPGRSRSPKIGRGFPKGGLDFPGKSLRLNNRGSGA